MQILDFKSPPAVTLPSVLCPFQTDTNVKFTSVTSLAALHLVCDNAQEMLS